MDVQIDIRNIREGLLAIIESGDKDVKALLDIWQRLQELDSLLSGLPLPKEIYTRVMSDIKVRESSLVRMWETVSKPARSTRS